jgi:hypothetical protein
LKAHKDKEREKRLKLNIHFSQELPFINWEAKYTFNSNYIIDMCEGSNERLTLGDLKFVNH